MQLVVSRFGKVPKDAGRVQFGIRPRARIEENFVGRLRLVSLSSSDYRKPLRLATSCGGTSGLVYDALHVVAASKADCSRIYSNNVRHFRGI